MSKRVNLIEVKTVSKKREIDRIAFALAIKEDGQRRRASSRANARTGTSEAGFMFAGQMKKKSRRNRTRTRTPEWRE